MRGFAIRCCSNDNPRQCNVFVVKSLTLKMSKMNRGRVLNFQKMRKTTYSGQR